MTPVKYLRVHGFVEINSAAASPSCIGQIKLEREREREREKSKF
jgi:hypothetical protein